jgi:hypothetical protein
VQGFRRAGCGRASACPYVRDSAGQWLSWQSEHSL